MRKLILTSGCKLFLVLTVVVLISHFFLRVVSCDEVKSEETVAEVQVENKKITLLEEQKIYLTTAKNTFLHYCAPCHGDKGNGKGIYFTIDLKPKPTDLTNVEYMAKLTDDYLLNFIKSGSAAMEKSDLCPPWGGTLDEERIKGLIAFLRSLTIQESSGDAETKAGETEVVVKSSAAGGTPDFIKYGVLILLSLVCIFAARKEWRKLKAESGTK